MKYCLVKTVCGCVCVVKIVAHCAYVSVGLNSHRQSRKWIERHTVHFQSKRLGPITVGSRSKSCNGAALQAEIFQIYDISGLSFHKRKLPVELFYSLQCVHKAMHMLYLPQDLPAFTSNESHNNNNCCTTTTWSTKCDSKHAVLNSHLGWK